MPMRLPLRSAGFLIDGAANTECSSTLTKLIRIAVSAPDKLAATEDGPAKMLKSTLPDISAAVLFGRLLDRRRREHRVFEHIDEAHQDRGVRARQICRDRRRSGEDVEIDAAGYQRGGVGRPADDVDDLRLDRSEE